MRNHVSSISLSVVAVASVTTTVAYLVWRKQRRHERTKTVLREIETKTEEEEEGDTLPSIISHFQDMKLDYNSTIEEANKRRTSAYYEKAREAHEYDLVPGVRSYTRLRRRREAEMKRIMKYHIENTKSQRTVVVMCDDDTSEMLRKARTDILDPLDLTYDQAAFNGAWVPNINIIPQQHLHVTVASVWWWHTRRNNNRELTEETAARFRQALVMEFHHAFQIELERIVLLGGRTLVALWRCIGERKNKDGMIIYDRHGEETDPFIKLRRDIVKCFTDEETSGKQPLTYAHRKESFAKMQRNDTLTKDTPPPKVPPPGSAAERKHSIELKTPGMESGDGFIHTTLARLPLGCLSGKDIELDPIHRLCREATATYCGHRMVVSKFRFLETTGAGGESNPCVQPIFDETIDAPIRVDYTDAGIVENRDLHATKNPERCSTIGAMPSAVERATVDGLFDAPSAVEENDDE